MANDIARHWRLREPRCHLEGSLCTNCGSKFFPSRTVCTECHSTNLEGFRFKGEGALYSYTTLASAPAGFEDQLPYSVGMVKLDEGPMIEAMLTDANQEDLHIGMRMEMVTRKLCDPSPNGLIIYGYKFRPVIGRKS